MMRGRCSGTHSSRREALECKRQRLRIRLERLYRQEADMLDGADLQNQIGTRMIRRYDMSLSEVQKAIKDLEGELEDLDAALDGGRRRTVAVVPRDW